jgi:hypothetical protein
MYTTNSQSQGRAIEVRQFVLEKINLGKIAQNLVKLHKSFKKIRLDKKKQERAKD